MRLLLSMLLAALPALALAQSFRPGPLATRVQVRGADCALFPTGADYGAAAKTAFSPSLRQAKETELKLLVTDLKRVDPYAGRLPKELEPARTKLSASLVDWSQQFYGFYNAQHQPCLFINAFYLKANASARQYWLRERVYARDGGCMFWQAIYNLATHRLELFTCNGPG